MSLTSNMGGITHPVSDSELARTSIYRIEIEEWSGKKKEASPDFPGAFLYGEHTPIM